MEISYYLLLFLFLYFITKNLLGTNKNIPPSPGVSLPIIGHLYLFKKPLHRTFASLAQKYGPILYLKFGSRAVVLVSSPALVEECFTKNDIIFANRPKFLAGKILGYDYSSLIWASYGPHWRNLRRIASVELLSSNRTRMFYNIRVEEVKSLACKLFKGSKDGVFMTVDMKSAFFELTLNVIMRMICGKRYYGDQEDSAEDEEGKRFKNIIKESFQLSGATNIGDFIPVLNWVGLNKMEERLQSLQRRRDEFLQELIEEHKKAKLDDSVSEKKKKKKSSMTMIDVLIELQKAEPEYYTDEIIRGLLQVMLSGGSDTSAATMEWALSLMLNNQEVIVKAREEIDKKIGQSELIKETEIANLPYLQAIIKETFRMQSPAAFLPPHESSEECTLGGFKIPRGTMLMVNMFAVHNDPNLWEEPTKFKPERFLEDDEIGCYKLLPFGAGRRGCPGEGVAMKIVGLALGTLIQCFEWERLGEEMVDMTEGTGLSTPKANPLIVKCRPRPTIPNLLNF